MELIKVSTKNDSKKFVAFPVFLYKDEPSWIRPLDKEVEKVFEPSSNNGMDKRECIRWILQENDRVIGRIAAFTRLGNSKKSNENLRGGIGFFDCIQNQAAANMLFNAGKNWLMDRGMQFMDGPINFGNRDKWWGLLTKGFHLEQNYQSNYNFPYYRNLFEDYGFKTYFEHYTFSKGIADPIHPRLKYKAELVSKDRDYKMVHFDFGQFDKMTEDIVAIYNRAWVNHEGVRPISLEEGRAMMEELKPVLDPKIIWIAYHREEPVGFYINIPEVNQWLRHVNGKLDFLGKLKFLWYRKTRPSKKMKGMVFGVVPEHQGKGVDGAMIMAFRKTALGLSYENLEISGIGDFNKKMILVVKQVGGEVCKVHTTYRYLFDRSLPFERMKEI